MARLKIVVKARSAPEESRICGELSSLLAALEHVEVVPGSGQPQGSGSILVLDSEIPDLSQRLAGEERQGRSIWLRIPDGSELPEAFVSGKVDDLLIHPIRPLELLGKLKHHEHLRITEEVLSLQSALGKVMSNLK